MEEKHTGLDASMTSPGELKLSRLAGIVRLVSSGSVPVGLAAWSIMPLNALYRLCLKPLWIVSICRDGGWVTTSADPGEFAASGRYMTFCKLVSRHFSKALNRAGRLVTSGFSGDLVQSSSSRQFSESMSHAPQIAEMDLSRTSPTRLLSCWMRLASCLTMAMEAISADAVPIKLVILLRYWTPLTELLYGGQNAYFSHASPVWGVTDGISLGSKVNLDAFVGLRAVMGVLGVFGVCVVGVKRDDMSSMGGSTKRMWVCSRIMPKRSAAPPWSSTTWSLARR